MIYSLTALHKRHSQKLISNIQVHIFQFYLVQGCRNGFKNLIFSFFTKKPENLKNPNFSFKGLFKEKPQYPDFRLTVTADAFQSN